MSIKKNQIEDFVSDSTQTALDLKANKDGETITNASVNGVTLTNAGVSSDFLDAEGNYTAPPGGDTLPVVDTTAIVKGSVDDTKTVRIEADLLTTATERVMTMPDKDITLVDDAEVVHLAGTETITGSKTYTATQNFDSANTEFGDGTGNVELSLNPLVSTGLSNIFLNGTGGLGRLTWNQAQTLLGLSATGAVPDLKILSTGDTEVVGKLGVNGATAPTEALEVGGTSGVDGIKFPDGTLQTTAAAGGGGGISEEFSAYGSANYTLTTAIAVIPFNTENFDTGSNYDTTTFQYTVPSDGKYQFTVKLNASGYTALDRLQLFFYKNAANIYTLQEIISGTESNLILTGIFDLTAADVIEVRGRNQTGARGSYGIAVTTGQFSGYKLV